MGPTDPDQLHTQIKNDPPCPMQAPQVPAHSTHVPLQLACNGHSHIPEGPTHLHLSQALGAVIRRGGVRVAH